jgi:threonine dehydrogenase-like Zn-dependent dehydrogenase
MKALVYQGVETLGFTDVPDAIPQAGEHLIKVEAVGICGSDMHAYLGHDARRPAPLILGHEAAGTIKGGTYDGMRVTVNPLVTCGICPACQAGRENLCPDRQIISMAPREGAFAQYVAMPMSNLVEVPDHVPLEKAALAEPLAVSWHAARLALEALHPSMERRALVIGGGAIGLAASLALKAMGLDDVTVVEPDPARCAFLCEQAGQIAVASTDQNYPIVIDAVGFGVTRASASSLVQPGGVIAHVGLGDDKPRLDVRRATCKRSSLSGPTHTLPPISAIQLRPFSTDVSAR